MLVTRIFKKTSMSTCLACSSALTNVLDGKTWQGVTFPLRQGRTLSKRLDLGAGAATVRPASLNYNTKARDSTDAYAIDDSKAYTSHAVRVPALTNAPFPTLCARPLVPLPEYGLGAPNLATRWSASCCGTKTETPWLAHQASPCPLKGKLGRLLFSNCW